MVIREQDEKVLQESPDRLLTVGEAAEILCVHPNTVRWWNSVGLLQSYRIGPRRDRRFRSGDIHNLLNYLRNSDKVP